MTDTVTQRKASGFNQQGGMLWSGLIESGIVQHLNADELKVLLYYLTMGRGSSTLVIETQQQIALQLGLSPSRVSRAVTRLCRIHEELGLANIMPPLLFDEEREDRLRKEIEPTGAAQAKGSGSLKRKLLRCSIHPFWGHKGSQASYRTRWHLYYQGEPMQSASIKRKHKAIRKKLDKKLLALPQPTMERAGEVAV